MTDCIYSFQDHLRNVEGFQDFEPRVVPQWLRERLDRAMRIRLGGVVCDDCLIDDLIAKFGDGEWLGECGLATIDDEECFVLTSLHLDEAVDFGLGFGCGVVILDDADYELPEFGHTICLMPDQLIRVFDRELYASIAAS
jgi:hypothetical protein